jgi:hypothetical protein
MGVWPNMPNKLLILPTHKVARVSTAIFGLGKGGFKEHT